MIYMGGKNRLGKRIAEVINRHYQPGWSYLEPFLGGAGVTPHVSDSFTTKVASDIDPDLMSMWQSAILGWVPPAHVTESQYREARAASVDMTNYPRRLRGFIKYACSWGGKPWGGYARGNRDYARIGSEGVVRKAAKMGDVSVCCADYWEYGPRLRDHVVYMDPPYEGTTGYGIPFDHEIFWDRVRWWSRDNVVLVSEYTAPPDFEAVAEFPLRNKLNDKKLMTEKVFKIRG